MFNVQRSLIAATVFGLVTASAMRVDAEAALNFVRNLTQLQLNCKSLQAEIQRSDVLSGQQTELYQRMAWKAAIARNVIEGKLSLREAVSQFQAISANCDYNWDYLRSSNPEMSYDIRCAHYVVDSIEYVLSSTKTNTRSVVAKYRSMVASWSVQQGS